MPSKRGDDDAEDGCFDGVQCGDGEAVEIRLGGVVLDDGFADGYLGGFVEEAESEWDFAVLDFVGDVEDEAGDDGDDDDGGDDLDRPTG